MTTDERIGAIAQSLELLSALHQDLEKQTAARFADTAARFADTLEFINGLARVAQAHEQRIERPEE